MASMSHLLPPKCFPEFHAMPRNNLIHEHEAAAPGTEISSTLAPTPRVEHWTLLLSQALASARVEQEDRGGGAANRHILMKTTFKSLRSQFLFSAIPYFSFISHFGLQPFLFRSGLGGCGLSQFSSAVSQVEQRPSAAEELRLSRDHAFPPPHACRLIAP